MALSNFPQNPGPCRIPGPQATFKSQIPTPRAIFLSESTGVARGGCTQLELIETLVLSRLNNVGFNSQMNSYNDLLQQFFAENDFVFCDNSNSCHASYYIEDGVHLSSTKGIQLLVNNMNKSVGNFIQPKNLDTFTFSRHQFNENTNRYKQTVTN